MLTTRDVHYVITVMAQLELADWLTAISAAEHQPSTAGGTRDSSADGGEGVGAGGASPSSAGDGDTAGAQGGPSSTSKGASASKAKRRKSKAGGEGGKECAIQ